MHVKKQESNEETFVFQWSSNTFPLFTMSLTNKKKFEVGAMLTTTAQKFVMSHGHQVARCCRYRVYIYKILIESKEIDGT
jgi:hypothetical protein